MDAILNVWRGGHTPSKITRGALGALLLLGMSQGWITGDQATEAVASAPEHLADVGSLTLQVKSLFWTILGFLGGSASSTAPGE